MGQVEPVPQKSTREQIRDQKRAVDRSKRAIEREKNRLEREKKKMLAEIKKMAMKGQHVILILHINFIQGAAKQLARTIAQTTTQINKMTEFSGQLTAVSLRISAISSLNELGNAMEEAAKSLTLVSNKLDTQKLNNMMKNMMKEDEKLEMKQEMMQDIMDSLGEGMDNKEEEDEVYKQVLQEVGVNYNDVLPASGAKQVEVPADQNKVLVGADDQSLDEMLKSLK